MQGLLRAWYACAVCTYEEHTIVSRIPPAASVSYSVGLRLLLMPFFRFDSEVETIALLVEVMISESNANYPDRVAEIFVLGAADV